MNVPLTKKHMTKGGKQNGQNLLIVTTEMRRIVHVGNMNKEIKNCSLKNCVHLQLVQTSKAHLQALEFLGMHKTASIRNALGSEEYGAFVEKKNVTS